MSSRNTYTLLKGESSSSSEIQGNPHCGKARGEKPDTETLENEEYVWFLVEKDAKLDKVEIKNNTTREKPLNKLLLHRPHACYRMVHEEQKIQQIETLLPMYSYTNRQKLIPPLSSLDLMGGA